jgi:hypothetical protein
MVADTASASGSSGSFDVPLGLVATVADKEYSTTWGVIFVGRK